MCCHLCLSKQNPGVHTTVNTSVSSLGDNWQSLNVKLPCDLREGTCLVNVRELAFGPWHHQETKQQKKRIHTPLSKDINWIPRMDRWLTNKYNSRSRGPQPSSGFYRNLYLHSSFLHTLTCRHTYTYNSITKNTSLKWSRKCLDL